MFIWNEKLTELVNLDNVLCFKYLVYEQVHVNVLAEMISGKNILMLTIIGGKDLSVEELRGRFDDFYRGTRDKS
jgi:hypothetical protein